MHTDSWTMVEGSRCCPFRIFCIPSKSEYVVLSREFVVISMFGGSTGFSIIWCSLALPAVNPASPPADPQQMLPIREGVLCLNGSLTGVRQWTGFRTLRAAIRAERLVRPL